MLKREKNERGVVEIVSTEELVPREHMLRKVDRAVDFQKLYEIVEPLYSEEEGRPSIDPVVLFKIVLLQHLDGLASLRGTLRRAQTDIAHRWFLGYTLNEELPHFSTVSYNFRHRYTEETIEAVFQWILEEAGAEGALSPAAVFIDGTHIKANANIHKRIKQEVPAAAKRYRDELLEEINADREAHGKKPFDDGETRGSGKKRDNTSKKKLARRRNSDRQKKLTPVSTTDPESGIFHKGEHRRCFAYEAHTACDVHGYVLETVVTPGNVSDSMAFDDVYNKVTEHFPEIETVVADAAYKTPHICKKVFDDGRVLSTAYKRPMTLKGGHPWWSYVYDEYYDCVLCPEYQPLAYRTTNRDGYREYKSDPKICAQCPTRHLCTHSKNCVKTVQRHIWKDYEELADDARYTPKYRDLYAKRKETIERVFADAKDKHAMRYTPYRGLAQVSKWVRLKFVAINLKKLAVWISQRPSCSSPALSSLFHFHLTSRSVWFTTRQTAFRQADCSHKKVGAVSILQTLEIYGILLSCFGGVCVSYRIYELSARAVACYARETGGIYSFHLSRSATEWCRVFGAHHEQDSNALFFQTMCVLRGDDYREENDALIDSLADVIFYMDFSGIFDRGAAPKQLERQRKAEDMFRPDGVWLDFGSGERRYLAFERSGSMSRQGKLSFIREDVYEVVRRRIMMDMTVRNCQLSKLYAYNGLMLSGGVRVEDVGIDRPHRVIVIDNPTRTVGPVEVITVEDDGTENSTRKYRRVEKRTDVDVTCFDGEGLISRQYAAVVDKAFCGEHVHTSFQIRLPYIKGMLHQVDFKDFLLRAGTKTVTDIWGVAHRIDDVDIILTKSMFKGYGWLTDSGMTWEDYWAVFRKYRHALYITNVSKERPERFTELNYQFLTTVSIRAEEFRPAGLPDGWDRSPEEDERHWLTKQTELAYYNFTANREFRRDYFLKELKGSRFFNRNKSREYHMAAALKKNPRFITEPAYAKRLDDMADKILKQYAVGRLIVAGDNR